MENNNIYSILGLLNRGRLLVSGADTVKQGIKKNKIHLIILTSDSSDNTKDKFIRLGKTKNIPVFIWGNMSQMGHILGKSGPKAVIGITDLNASNKIMNLILGVNK